MKPILLGVAAAFFFAFTFVLNAVMEVGGGHWAWSASLRFFWMVPLLLGLVLYQRKGTLLWQEMKRRPFAWMLWSFVGFFLFYAPLTFAAVYAPGWLIAGTWQLTIVAGILLAPFFFTTIQTATGIQKIRKKIPWRSFGFSLIIVFGVVLMQVEQAKSIAFDQLMLGVFPLLIAAFAYPLGNRKMMELTDGRLDAFSRVLGMTLASLPFWIMLAIYGYSAAGIPSTSQTLQTLIVAVSSGVIATVLFFQATDLVRQDMQRLASVEATQSMEVIFALVGEMILLGTAFPSLLSWIGLLTVMLGMIVHAILAAQSAPKIPINQKE